MAATVVTTEQFPKETPDDGLLREISLRIKAGAIRSWVEIKDNQKILFTEWNVFGENDQILNCIFLLCLSHIDDLNCLPDWHHHVQVDVKFLDFKTQEGRKVRYLQYTAIDDARRIHALKIYEQHTQQDAIDFVDYIIAKFPFRINTICTDNGHEFQVKFHWHL